MGTPIGQVTSTLASLRTAPEFGRARLSGRGVATDASTRPESTAQPSARERPAPQAAPDRPTVGFGEGSLSTPALALRTLGRTVQEARESLPSLDELRARFQLAAAERRAEITEEIVAFQSRDIEQPIELRPEERGIPEGNPRVARFAEEGAGVARDRQDAAPQPIAPDRFAGAEPETEVRATEVGARPREVALDATSVNEVVSDRAIDTRPAISADVPRNPVDAAQGTRLDIQA